MLRIVLFVGGILAGMTASLARAGETDLINGNTYHLEGSVGVTFWTTKHPYSAFSTDQKYRLLKPEAEHMLLEGARIEAPPGFIVRQESLGVHTEKASYQYTVGRTRTTRTYEEHRIRGQWSVTVPRDCPEGEYTIKILFPQVAVVRDLLKAEYPGGETAISLHFKTFKTAQSRSQARWDGGLWKGVGCLVAMTITLAIVGFGIFSLFYAGSFHGLLLAGLFGVGAWYSSLGFFGFMGQALADLHVLDPLRAVGIAAGVNLGYFLCFWIISGFGRWGRIWAICLSVELLLILALAAVVAFSPFTAESVVEVRHKVPVALSAMLPGLLLTWLAATIRAVRRKAPPGETVPAVTPRKQELELDVEKAFLEHYMQRMGSPRP